MTEDKTKQRQNRSIKMPDAGREGSEDTIQSQAITLTVVSKVFKGNRMEDTYLEIILL